MRKSKLWTILILTGPLLLLSFQNCADQSYYDAYMMTGVPVTDSSSSFSSYEGVRVLNSEVFMNCFEDHVQMGGVCNDADAADNFIRYWMTFNGSTTTWGVPPTATTELSTKCENGRWYAVVPKPTVPELVVGTSFLDFEMHFQIYTRQSGASSFTAGSKAPVYTISIQQNQACTL